MPARDRIYLWPDDLVSPGLADPLSADRIARDGPGFGHMRVLTRSDSGGPALISAARRAGDALSVDGDAWRRIVSPRVVPACFERAGLDWSRPLVMGIVNLTPDSFSDGGRLADTQAAVDHAMGLLGAGADILDLGGESTRPGADPVPLEEELSRVLPVLEALRSRTRAPISIDTRKAEVMAGAVAAGADIINDVSALTYDPVSLETAARLGVPVILMHAQGNPQTMQQAPTYRHVLLDVHDALEGRIAACEAAGIARANIIVDPGIGFGKTLTHNLQLLAGLRIFHGLGCPVLLGASRKSFIGKLDGPDVAHERVPGSLAAALEGVRQGVQIVRMHDVAETVQALRVWTAMAGANPLEPGPLDSGKGE